MQLRDGGLDPNGPRAVTTPNSAKWPRNALISMVLPDQKVAHLVQHQDRLLVHALDRDEAHRRARELRRVSAAHRPGS